MRVGEGHAQTAPLRAVETTAGDGDAANHVGAGNAIEQLGIVVDAVGVGDALGACPLHGFEEGALKLEVANFVAAVVEVKQAVETETLLRSDEGTFGGVALQTATGADTHEVELTEFGTLGAGVEVDVGQRVEFVDDDVDVVATDTGGNDRDALAFVGTGHGAEFAALDFEFTVLKVRCDELNSAGIATRITCLRLVREEGGGGKSNRLR